MKRTLPYKAWSFALLLTFLTTGCSSTVDQNSVASVSQKQAPADDGLFHMQPCGLNQGPATVTYCPAP